MTRDEVLSLLIDKSMQLKLLLGMRAGSIEVADDKLVGLTEQIIVDATERRNRHDRDHIEKYSAQCIFCVEAVKESNA